MEEIHEVKNLMEEAERELALSGETDVQIPDLGIMIEIPSAVMMAEEFGKQVDFFSIGTNDLVQYTLAVDRGNEKVAKLYSHFHPAVLRMVEQTIQAGHKSNVTVGMCGEMAGDPMAVPLLIAMGLEQFSASHNSISSHARCLSKHTSCKSIWETKNVTESTFAVWRGFPRRK